MRITRLVASGRARILVAVTATAIALHGCLSGTVVDGTVPDAPLDAAPVDSLGPPADAGVVDMAAEPLPAPGLQFAESCRAGQRVTIAAVGDVLLHEPLQRQAYASPDRHLSLWTGMLNLIARADVSYANLEGPAAAGVNQSGIAVADPGMVMDGQVYSGTPPFNYHPSIITSLLKSGFDVVSTANNHAMDRRSLGIDQTTRALQAQGLPYSGTHTTDAPNVPWYTTTTAAGYTIAWLACSYGTNLPETAHQVLLCYDDKATVLATVKALAASPAIDAVIVTPHWGIDWALTPSHKPTPGQQQLAHELLEAGAVAVLGNHPHVVQPWEKYVTRDGRETFLIYCIGNFTTGQDDADERASLLLYLGLTFTRSPERRVTINGVRYIPTYMLHTPTYTVVPADTTKAGAAAYTLVTKILDPRNALPSSAPLVTNPECN